MGIEGPRGGVGRDAALMLEVAKPSRSGKNRFTMVAAETFGRDGSDVKCKDHTGTKVASKVDVDSSHQLWHARMPLMPCSALLARRWSFALEWSQEGRGNIQVARSHQAICDILRHRLKKAGWTLWNKRRS